MSDQPRSRARIITVCSSGTQGIQQTAMVGGYSNNRRDFEDQLLKDVSSFLCSNGIPISIQRVDPLQNTKSQRKDRVSKENVDAEIDRLLELRSKLR